MSRGEAKMSRQPAAEASQRTAALERLEPLVEAYVLETLDEQGGVELSRLLAESREARDLFRSRLRFHQLCYDVFAEDGGLLDQSVGFFQPLPPPSETRGVRLLPLAFGLVASVALVVGAIVLTSRTAPSNTQPVAHILTSDSLPLGPLARGRVSLPSGFAEIEMIGGARFAIESGTEVELLAPDRVRLLRGELGADVPPRARGFTVVTDDGAIVDWGTRFGVVVEPDLPTTAMVFSGEIEVVAASRSQLFQNRQAVTFDRKGSLVRRDVAIDERGFPMPSRVEVIPLVLGDFESPDDYAVAGASRAGLAAWVGDLCRIVGHQGGVRPAQGSGMLQLVAASADGRPSDQNFCNVGQQIDLTEYELVGAEIEVSMQVNRLATPTDIDSLFKLSVCDVSQETAALSPRGQTLLTAFVLSDADAESWETVAVRGELPPGLERINVVIGAQENVWNDRSGEAIEFAGHFIDEVQVRLILPARGSLF